MPSARKKMRRHGRAFRSPERLFFLAAAGFLALGPAGAVADPLNRDSDPVILTGAELDLFLGTDPDAIVGFRYDTEWVQIPVQVDERAEVDFGTVYGLDPTGLTTLGYCDPETYMGPDPDPGFDADDELVFMGKDAGEGVPVWETDPPGVYADRRLAVIVTDPLDHGEGIVYLFETAGSHTPGAGVDYIDYAFDLLSGSYLETYDTLQGPNPENSVVGNDHYRMHFSDRWVRDEIQVFAGGGSGAEILDRHKNLFGPGNCQRSEDTFSVGEGAFFANRDGPVRAIRSYLGANSGPLTQRDHFFYQRRHDVVTRLRVHTIPGVMDFYDYSPEAVGMSYFNDLNRDGVPIDGQPTEFVAPGPIQWEMVTGDQGTLIFGHLLINDIPGFSFSSYYLDDTTPADTQCTGDPWAYGSSGLWIDHTVPNTDPTLGSHYILVPTRVSYIEPPNQLITLAEQRYRQSAEPLIADVFGPAAVAAAAAVPALRLEPNRPNPFNPVTRIFFELAAPREIRLVVYSVQGRLVRTLVQESMPAGRHQLLFDGKDDSGRALASGSYLCSLESGSERQVRRVVLLN